jgi:hypothetical protein
MPQGLRQVGEKIVFLRLLKNAPASGRPTKFFIGNGFKPFPTV